LSSSNNSNFHHHRNQDFHHRSCKIFAPQGKTDSIRILFLFLIIWSLCDNNSCHNVASGYVIIPASTSYPGRAARSNPFSNWERTTFSSSTRLFPRNQQRSFILFDSDRTGSTATATTSRQPLDLQHHNFHESRSTIKNASAYPSFLGTDHRATNNHTGIPLFLLSEDDDDDDVPRPTENGGYTHTAQSKAKISAANKGKTPWNKGMNRPEDVKARIAAGVRSRNRERFLQKLQDMGVTEEEYEEQKKQERRRRDAERRARRTENGGYRPTNETRQKISKILKEKYAAGEIKPRTVDASKVRRGFTHSPETRAKISESLKKRWATDPEYRAKMKEKTMVANTDESIRKKIAETLRQKWQDPEFRAQMMSKFTNRKRSPGVVNEDHRQKISAAMKAKWQDEEYRQKTLQSIAKRQESMRSTQTAKPKKGQQKASAAAKAKLPKTQQERPARSTSVTPPTKANDNNENNEVVIYEDDEDDDGSNDEKELFSSKPRPVQPLTQPKAKRKRAAAAAASTAATAHTEPPKAPVVNGVVVKLTPPPPPSTSRLLQRQPTAMPERAATLSSGRAAQPNRKKQSVNDNQSTSSLQRNAAKHDSSEGKLADAKSLTDWRLVERDKDFYELAGMDDDDDIDPSATKAKRKKQQQPPQQQQPASDGNVELLRAERRDLYDLLYGDGDDDDDDRTDPLASSSSSLFALGDENLDDFDPYGLEDF